MSLADEVLSYAAYINAPRGHFDGDEQRQLDEDTAKARAAMETAWLERVWGGWLASER